MSKSINVHDVSLFRGCSLKKFKNMFKYGSDKPVIKDFIDHLLPQPNGVTLITQLSEMYVLVADMEKEYLSNKKWKDFMNEEQYKLLETNQQYVIGYMLINDTHGKDKHHYIDFINTRLKGHNIADLMIRKYITEKRCGLYPQEIMYSAVGYWRKNLKYIFDNIDYSSDIIDEIKIFYNIKMELKWDWLINLFAEEFNNLNNDEWSDMDELTDSDSNN
jgi:hypothetical protein